MTCIFNKNIVIPIVKKCAPVEERNLNLILINSSDTLQIKIRDPAEYSFNFTENIDLGDYEIMRAKQNLDINFGEFTSTILELLQQIYKKDMFLKCEVSDTICTLVFYNKTKIKTIIHLTIDLHLTSQKELICELMNNIHYVKENNEKLQVQILNMKKIISEKDMEIKHLNLKNTENEKECFNVLKSFEDRIIMTMRDMECLILRQMNLKTLKINQLINQVNHLRGVATLKTDSNARLLKNIENLTLESNNKATSIEQLRRENIELHNMKVNLEQNLSQLKCTLSEKEVINRELQSKNQELRSDMEKASIIIAQKKASIDELSKDLVQANQMLVNFNNHYDSKVKTIEHLEAAVASKDEIIAQENQRYCNLQREFDNYRLTFSKETFDRMKQDLILSRSQISELENSVRKANKLTALLSEKVNKIGI